MVHLLTLKVWLTKASKLGFGMQWDGVSTGVRAADLAAATAALWQSPCTAGTIQVQRMGMASCIDAVRGR